MDELLQNLLKKLKKLKGVSDTQSDDVFLFALETAINEIFNYCHIDELPQRLYNTAIMMAIDAINEVQANSGGTNGVESEVKSLTEGDFAISKVTSLEVIQGLSALRKASFIRNYSRTLNSFRKLL
ncbi:hypothetical protein [Enterococcus italicus]|uniref:hypothetical protein n=1 Tax=Enterococcus italicus TaxID=246144 RepID=UPI0020741477|nr:hypothetical protein [Enterococcus italicus]